MGNEKSKPLPTTARERGGTLQRGGTLRSANSGGTLQRDVKAQRRLSRRVTGEQISKPLELQAAPVVDSGVPRPNPEELQQQVQALMTTFGLQGPELMKLSEDKQWELLQQYQKQQQLQKVDIGDEPEDYVKLLTEDLSLSMLVDLRVGLSSKPVQWVRRFIEVGGLRTIFMIMSKLALRRGDRRELEETGKKLLEYLRGVRALMNVESGMVQALTDDDSYGLKCIALCYDTYEWRTKRLVLEMLGGVCVLPGCHKQTLNAMSYYTEMTSEKYRFQMLMRNLTEATNSIMTGGALGQHTEFILAVLQFINALVNSPEDLLLRVHLRNEFLDLNIERVVDALKVANRDIKNEDLETQIIIFEDEYAQDKQELHDRFLDADISDTYSMFTAVNSKCQNQATFVWWRKLLQEIMLVPYSDPAVAPKYLQLIRNMVAQVVLQRPHMEDPDFHLSYKLDVNKLVETYVYEDELKAQRDKCEQLEKDLKFQMESYERKIHEIRKALQGEGLLPTWLDVDELKKKPNANLTLTTAVSIGKEGGPGAKIPGAPGGPPPPPNKIPQKRRITPREKMRSVNWSKLGHAKVKGTVFEKVDDEVWLARFDVDDLERNLRMRPAATGRMDIYYTTLTWDKPQLSYSTDGSVWASIDMQPSQKPGYAAPLWWAATVREDTLKFKFTNGKEEYDDCNGQPYAVEKSGTYIVKDHKCILLDQQTVVQLFDFKRAQNMGIMLARIPMSYEEIRKALLDMDPTRIDEQMAANFLANLPTADEIHKVKSFKGDKGRLGRAEQFVLEVAVQVSTINRYEKRLKSLLYKATFRQRMDKVEPDMEAVVAACKQLMGSGRLKELLGVVLAYGNYCNGGKPSGQAFGYRIDSLLKLPDTRTTANGTLLDYMSAVLDAGWPDLLKWPGEVAMVQEAKKVNIAQCRTEVLAISAGMKEVEEEMNYYLGSNTEEGARQYIEQMRDQFYGIYKDAPVKLMQLMREMEAIFGTTVAFFGEDPKTATPDQFFGVFACFADTFQAAHRVIMDKRAMQQEAVRKQSIAEKKKVEALERAQAQKGAKATRRQERISLVEGPPGEIRVPKGASDSQEELESVFERLGVRERLEGSVVTEAAAPPLRSAQESADRRASAQRTRRSVDSQARTREAGPKDARDEGLVSVGSSSSGLGSASDTAFARHGSKIVAESERAAGLLSPSESSTTLASQSDTGLSFTESGSNLDMSLSDMDTDTLQARMTAARRALESEQDDGLMDNLIDVLRSGQWRELRKLGQKKKWQDDEPAAAAVQEVAQRNPSLARIASLNEVVRSMHTDPGSPKTQRLLKDFTTVPEEPSK